MKFLTYYKIAFVNKEAALEFARQNVIRKYVAERYSEKLIAKVEKTYV